MSISAVFIHHSADMYGADKMLLSLVGGLNKKGIYPIVILPEHGPLSNYLDQMGVEKHILPVAKISRSIFTPLGLLRFPFDVFSSIKALNKILNGRQIDIVHSNTLAVFSGAVWSTLNRVKHVWHVHEIIMRPTVARKIFPWLLHITADSVAVISRSVEQHLIDEKPVLERKTTVIWNGVPEPREVSESQVQVLRQQIDAKTDDVVIALVGRLNKWKGQGLLVQSAEILAERNVGKCLFLIVGSPPAGQEHWKTELNKRICESPVREKIRLLDYTCKIEIVWKACDIAVVPSTEPEPFGIVALEAMLAKRPVVASDHGGLSEVVVGWETGLLFKPGSAVELADKLQILIESRQLRLEFGQSGAKRAREKFSVEAYVQGFNKLYRRIGSSS